MKSLRSRTFFAVWRALYSESNPGLGRQRWTCEDVDWVRETHAFSGADYAFRVEAHTLTLQRNRRTVWSLLVVVEHWQTPPGSGEMKTNEWCRPLVGSSRQILAWFAERA